MHPPSASAVLLPLLVAPLPGLAMLHCENVLVDGYKFNLEKLKGPHSVVTSKYDSATHTYHNTTYTLDICGTLKKSGKAKPTEECPNGSRVCAISRFIQDDVDRVETVTAIAGALENVGGSPFKYEATRLNGSDSNSDAQKNGLRLVLKGGKHPLDGPVKERREQKAIVELLCGDNEGTEGEWDGSEDKYSKRGRRDDGKHEGGSDDDGKDKSFPEHQLKKKDAALIWESYGPEKDGDVLRLTWRTKYACEKKRDGEDGGDGGGDGGGHGGDASAHWGFFTWLVIVVFLGTAAYLIFGSWLNYTRYGARGWDLVPHGDTIRDIPYLLRDWTRRVLNTVQGTGSRGGYSAV